MDHASVKVEFLALLSNQEVGIGREMRLSDLQPVHEDRECSETWQLWPRLLHQSPMHLVVRISLKVREVLRRQPAIENVLGSIYCSRCVRSFDHQHALRDLGYLRRAERGIVMMSLVVALVLVLAPLTMTSPSTDIVERWEPESQENIEMFVGLRLLFEQHAQ